jgi:ADP-dependent phosphofructokinase/glucokinase
MSNNKVIEFEDVKEQRKKVKVSFKDIVTGNDQLREFLSTHIWFIIYVAFLGFLYISNHYALERQTKYYLKLDEQVKNLKSEAVTTSAELMGLSSRTSVREEVERRGLDLKEATKPPVLLKVDESK